MSAALLDAAPQLEPSLATLQGSDAVPNSGGPKADESSPKAQKHAHTHRAPKPAPAPGPEPCRPTSAETVPSGAAELVGAHGPLRRLRDDELRVAIVTACYYVPDGVSLTIRRLESYLRSRGAAVLIVTTVPDDSEVAAAMGDAGSQSVSSAAHVLRVAGVAIPFSLAGAGYRLGVGFSAADSAALAAFAPNIVHLTVPDLVGLDVEKWCRLYEPLLAKTPAGLPVPGASSGGGVACMATWHSNYADYLRFSGIGLLEVWLRPVLAWYIQRFYQRFRRVFVPTPFMRRKLLEEGLGAMPISESSALASASTAATTSASAAASTPAASALSVAPSSSPVPFRDTCELHLWGRGVDMELFTPQRHSAQFRRSRGIADDEVVIMWVGRLVPEKRPDIWMHAIERLAAEGLRFKGLVVGHGTYEGAMARLPNTVCTGWLSGPQLAEAYASCDVLLFPSSVETFGNVTLEALACGTVCVVEENCGGHLVQNGVNGFVATDGDKEAFYKATRELVVNRERRLEMSKRARESSWAWERHQVMQAMLENYKDCIEDLQRRPYTEELRAAARRSNSAVGRFFSWSTAHTVCTPVTLAFVRAQECLDFSWAMLNKASAVLDCLSPSSAPSVTVAAASSFDVEAQTGATAIEKKVATAYSSNGTWNFVSRIVDIVAVTIAYLLVLLFVLVSVGIH